MKKFLFVFFIIGTLLLGVTGYLASRTLSFLNEAQRTTGLVTHNEISYSKDSDGNRSTSYYPIVVFVDDEGEQITFRSSVGTNPPSYQKGERVEVLYHSGNSTDATINGFIALWLGPMICGILGLVFFLIGFVPYLLGRRSKKRKAELLQTGRHIQATIDSVGLNTSLKVNGRSPYVIYCQWVDPLHKDQLHQFRSENIWFNPEPFIKEEQISVYIDEQKPKRYYVDIRFLPKV